MNRPIIEIENLSRTFTVAESHEGFWGSVRGLFSGKHTVKVAVDDLSFSVEQGEFVGYVGENGAGKSTTIKMLTGVLVPTSGLVRVAGIVPYEDRKTNAKNIGVVFGQRSQLWWDLPVRESFDLLRSIFRVPDDQFARNYNELVETLELTDLLKVPVRKLSLGQRMRCDLAAALLHGPKILFLDEPTIGLDIIAKDQVRRFLGKINRERGTTIILTTHDMDDIEALCGRIMILDEGKLVYDGATERLKQEFVHEKVLEIELAEECPEFVMDAVTVTKKEGNRVWLSFRQEERSLQEVIGEILDTHCVKDISIHEPKVADIVKTIYKSGVAKPEETGASAITP